MSELASVPSLADRAGASAASVTERELTLLTELSDWISLLKPRVISLVVFTGVVGLLIAPGPHDLLLSAGVVLCTAVGAGAAGALNMWYDRDIDQVMRRTAWRPIPSGRISSEAGFCYGLLLAILSVLTMLAVANTLAAVLLACAIFYYVCIYTMGLKRRTPQNIVIGGAAGAFPPLIGWAAITGSLATLPALLFVIIFLWTPPHFWSLSLFVNEDYARAGVPMLPVVAGPKVTRHRILTYTVVLVLASLVPWALNLTGAIYGISALALGAGFLWHAFRVLRDRQDERGVSKTKNAPAKAAFRYSLYYLFLLFTAVALDRLVLG